MILLAGITDPIQRPLTALLEWLHTTLGLSWAWSIIALTLIVRFVIVPLTVKQIRSMQKLQQHAPELKAIQAKYKNRKSREDRQRMNEEIMTFYRENKVNPAASCLPILVQIPVFISLFFVLKGLEKNIVDKKYPGSDLGWLNVVPDITENVNAHWSGWLLLVIYVASQLASIISMPTTDPRQRWIFVALPFVFIPFILTFPVGLMLYWATTNLWTVGQGIVTRRLVPRKPPPPPKRTSRTPPREEESADGGAAGKAVQPSRATQPGQQRVRRRKKKGPRSRR